MDACEVLDLARSCPAVEPLRIARLSNLQRNIHQHFEKWNPPLIVECSDRVAISAKRAHKACEDDHAGIGKNSADFPGTTHVLCAILRGETEIAIEPMPKIVAIDPIAEPPDTEQARFDTDCDRALARAREASEPNRRTGLSKEPLAVRASDRSTVPNDI